MSNPKEAALECLAHGLSVVFLRGGENFKRPALTNWEDLERKALTPGEVEVLLSGGVIRPEVEKERTRKDGTKYTEKGIKAFAPAEGIAIIEGKVSGSLEVIDVDCKHDPTGTLWERYQALIEAALPELYPRLVIATTRTKGYHIYYRCQEIEGNQKLANLANKEVIIETRGEGGYVVAHPTGGYAFTQGGPGNIPTITPGERARLLELARSFDEKPAKKSEPPQSQPAPIQEATAQGSSIIELSPFEDYNNRGDVIALLKAHGWKEVGTEGERVKVSRPGDTDAKDSGDYHKGLKILKVFSTSTEFEAGQGYNPSQVFTLIACGRDKKKAFKELLRLGYGKLKPREDGVWQLKPGEDGRASTMQTKRVTVNQVNTVTRVMEVISTPGDVLTSQALTESGDIIISSPGPEATAEVLQAIDMATGQGRVVYVRQDGVEKFSFIYQLGALIEGLGDGPTAAEAARFLDEVIKVASGIDNPIHRDMYKRGFLDWGAPQGITDESYQVAVERLTTTRAKEERDRALDAELSKIARLHKDGKTPEALDELEAASQRIRAKVGKELLPPPLSFANILEGIARTPASLKTGYPSLDRFAGFTPGAISLVAGRPSHGKTAFMFNLLLRMSELYPGKKFYFFSYEEPLSNLSIKLLNTLTATNLSKYFPNQGLSRDTNYEFIKDYIKHGRGDIKAIEEAKAKLKGLWDGGRIEVIDRSYSVEELHKILTYLNGKEEIGAVFIDYIQRMRTERKTQDKRTEVAHISDKVLQIAKETGLPIILGAQLNRGAKDSPALEGLKEAGNLEEDANTVLSVYNEWRGFKEKGEAPPEPPTGKEPGEAVNLVITALKNREGQVNAEATLEFHQWEGRISEKVNPSQYRKPPQR